MKTKKLTKKKVTRKQNALQESLEYIKESKKFIYAVTLIFFASSLIGYAFSDQLTFFDDLLKDLVDKTEGKNTLELTWFILSNNATSAFVGLTLGIILGVFPIVNSIFNGTILGYVYQKAAMSQGYGVIIYLVPHGIFELPAIFISLGLGVRLGLSLVEKNKKEVLLQRIKKSLKVFLTIILPLLIIAAIIEGLLINL